MVKKVNGFIESIDFAGNTISFGVDNSSSSHADNH